MTCLVYLTTPDDCKNRRVEVDKISCSTECPGMLFLQKLTKRGNYQGIGCLSYDGQMWVYTPADASKQMVLVLRWVVMVE